MANKRRRTDSSRNHKQLVKARSSPWITILTLVTSCFALLCSVLFLLASISQNMGAFTTFIGVVGIALSGFAVFFIAKYPNWVKNILCIGMTFFTLSFGLFILITAFYPQQLPDENESVVIVVFGCHTNGYIPGRTLITRLNLALELEEKYSGAMFIVTGAQGENETVAEAYAMQKYLAERGVDESRIIVEADASDTLQNLSNSAEIIESFGLSDKKLILLSSTYHIPRILFAAQNYVGGIYNETELYTCGSISKTVYYFISDYLREYLAWAKLLGRITYNRINELITE